MSRHYHAPASSTTPSGSVLKSKTFRDPSVCKAALVWQCPSQLLFSTKRATPVHPCRLDHDPYFKTQYTQALSYYQQTRGRAEPDWDPQGLVEGDPWGYMFETLEQLEGEIHNVESNSRSFFSRPDLFRDFGVTDDRFCLVSKQIRDLYYQADQMVDRESEVQPPALDILLDQIRSLEETMITQLSDLAKAQVAVIIKYYSKRKEVKEAVIGQLRREMREEIGGGSTSTPHPPQNAQNGQNDQNSSNLLEIEPNSTQNVSNSQNFDTITSTLMGDDRAIDIHGQTDQNSMQNIDNNQNITQNQTRNTPSEPTLSQIATRINTILPKPPQVVNLELLSSFRWDFDNPSESYYNDLESLESEVTKSIAGLKMQVCETCCGLVNLQEERQRISDHVAGKVHLAFRDIRTQVLQYVMEIRPLVPVHEKRGLVHPWGEWGHAYVPPTEIQIKLLQEREEYMKEAVIKIEVLEALEQGMEWDRNNLIQNQNLNEKKNHHHNEKNVNVKNGNHFADQNQNGNNDIVVEKNDNQNDDNPMTDSTTPNPLTSMCDEKECNFDSYSDDDDYFPNDDLFLLEPTMVLAMESTSPFLPFKRPKNTKSSHFGLFSDSSSIHPHGDAKRDNLPLIAAGGGLGGILYSQNQPRKEDFHKSESEAFRTSNRGYNGRNYDKRSDNRDFDRREGDYYQRGYDRRSNNGYERRNDNNNNNNSHYGRDRDRNY